MTGKALVVGCNYAGTNNALNGCINDANAIRNVLIECKGFRSEDITIMVDTPGSNPQPTGINIRNALESLVAQARPGDSLVFHYSGHGTQVPSADGDEADRKDEAICPTDMNLIVDDDLKAIVEKVPDGVAFLMISDCCHSGTLLDQGAGEVRIAGNKDGRQHRVNGPSLAELLGRRALSDKEWKNRSLSLRDLCHILTERSGKETTPLNIRQTLGTMFGGDAGAIVHRLHARRHPEGRGEHGKLGGMLGHGRLGGHLLHQQQGEGQGQEQKQEQSTGQSQSADKSILISGCQDFETSADACPSGDKSQAFGALTNTLTNIVRHNPNIDYYDLVTEIRSQLQAGGFSQNPCLVCTETSTKKQFAA